MLPTKKAFGHKKAIYVPKWQSMIFLMQYLSITINRRKATHEIG
ncbi:hypothetical protein D3OALGA1CA_3444 [Olavius algarvensis associated proteobacterium Delta 3]|nr:hypothetical protein D3OALGA1CA_3444 [Olavius algarvensis associated proteobacterium Delta 3]